MSDDEPGSGAPSSGDGDVGSVGEEAARLFGALSGWASEKAGDPSTGAAGERSEALGGVLGRLAADLDQHIATGGEDCRYCPVCQLIHAVRETSPEAREQISAAARSLLHAAAGLLATQAPDSRGQGVEKIDLSDDAPWDEER